MKLKILQDNHKSWNTNVFSYIHENLNNIDDKVDTIQILIHANGYSNFIMNQGKQAQLELEKALSYEEYFWKEKIKIK